MKYFHHRSLGPGLPASILLVGLVLFAALATAQPEPEGEARRIGEIRFHIANVYTEEEIQESSWSETVASFHIKTRESVIRNRILFREGDVLDMELVEQSERKLRWFAFVNEAQITVVPVDDQSVDIEIRTRDAWSLMPSLTLDGGGDVFSLEAHLEESNLLGFGKKVFVEGIYQTDIEDWTMRYGYSDPQILSSRWVGSAKYTNGPLIESFLVSTSRPLYSLDSKWAFGAHASAKDQIVRRFEGGEESSRFGKEQVSAKGYVKRAFGARFRKTTVKVSLQYLRKDFSFLGSETTEAPPPDQSNLTPQVNISRSRTSSWKEATYRDKMGPTEDLWLGSSYGTHVGYGIPVENGFELWDVGGYYSRSESFTRKQLLKAILNVNTEVVRKTIAIASLKYYKGFSRHTLATRFKVNYGWDLDNTTQFTLGANSGLRGYSARRFTGEKLMLLNLEDRQFWGTYTIGPKLALGTVVFVDAGNVWKEDEEPDLSDLNWSAGAGLRIGWSSLPKQPIFRVDFGWAFGGQDDFAVTLGAEQHF